MPTFSKAPQTVIDMALEVLCRHESHKPLLDAKVKIDYVMAFADVDPDTGKKLNDAIRKGGIRAIGIALKVSLKDRAKGMGDAEILLDGDHWNEINNSEKYALLDHESQHLAVKTDKCGTVRDDLGRPVINLRKHDYEWGFFNVVAERNGAHSIEQIYVAGMMERNGQLYLPSLFKS